MRYENPLYLAEEAAALNELADGRLALGISRGSPEPALRGYEAFGYARSDDDRSGDLAREKFDLFMRAVAGEKLVDADPHMYGPGQRLALEPHSPILRDRIWWGAGSRQSAIATGKAGLHLMSSTLLTEATGEPFDVLQRKQIDAFREAYREAGHTGAPRTSVSRSIFPLVSDQDRMYFGLRSRENQDQIGVIDGYRSTFGKTYADEPDRLIDQLRRDEALMAADTVLLTIPNQLGPEYCAAVLENFAKHVAPELGWLPNTEGPVRGAALLTA